MSGPPTFTGSRIPGAIPNNLTIIDYSGAFTAWYEAASQTDSSGVKSNVDGSGSVEVYAVSGDMPIPFESSLQGNPAANYNYVAVTTAYIGSHPIVIANYDVSPQGTHEFGRIIEAVSYLDQVYLSLSSEVRDSLSRLQSIFYTDGPGRSGVDLAARTFMLSADDMVGKDGRGGFSTMTIADRIVHDAHHIVQYENGDYISAGNFSTPAQIEAGITLERNAIIVELQAAEALLTLPAAQSWGTYGALVNKLRDYVNPDSPNYSMRQQMLRDRLVQPFVSNPSGGGGGDQAEENM